MKLVTILKSQECSQTNKAIEWIFSIPVCNIPDKIAHTLWLCRQVVVNNPVPDIETKDGGAFEDTMLLLEIIKEKRQQEMKEIKVKYQAWFPGLTWN